jgi:hypothetical protein
MYNSLKKLYKNMMFPNNSQAHRWTLAQIDELDVHFFSELMTEINEKPPEQDVYLSDIW